MGYRSVELMAQRALQRIAFKGPIASQGAFRHVSCMFLCAGVLLNSHCVPGLA